MFASPPQALPLRAFFIFNFPSLSSSTLLFTLHCPGCLSSTTQSCWSEFLKSPQRWFWARNSILSSTLNTEYHEGAVLQEKSSWCISIKGRVGMDKLGREQEGRHGGCRVGISWQGLPRQLRARDLQQLETNSSPGWVRRDDPPNGVTNSRTWLTNWTELRAYYYMPGVGWRYLSVDNPARGVPISLPLSMTPGVEFHGSGRPVEYTAHICPRHHGASHGAGMSCSFSESLTYLADLKFRLER